MKCCQINLGQKAARREAENCRAGIPIVRWADLPALTRFKWIFPDTSGICGLQGASRIGFLSGTPVPEEECRGGPVQPARTFYGEAFDGEARRATSFKRAVARSKAAVSESASRVNRAGLRPKDSLTPGSISAS